MRYAILGDIHGNFEALQTAVNAIKRIGVDQFLQVGDIVGYGADPVACIQLIRDLKTLVVAGNHDWAVIGKLDTAFFNNYAREAVAWTQAHLGRQEMHYLESLPLVVEAEDFTLVHSTLDQPEVFEYIQTYYDAHRSLQALRTPVCFMGHSHVPMAFIRRGGIVHTNAEKLCLVGASASLINVGSIGQPRDENPKTAFAIYDSSSREYMLCREEYPHRATAEKIRKAGLPAILGERLQYGR